MLTPPSTSSRPCKYGHVFGKNANGGCRECHRLRQVTYRVTNPLAILESRRRYSEENLIKIILRDAKLRARKGGYACTITQQDISVPEFCPILGIRLERNKDGAQPNSPSLDKIVPELGYVPGNVWVISYRANWVKNNATLGELQLIVDGLKKVFKFPWEQI